MFRLAGIQIFEEEDASMESQARLSSLVAELARLTVLPRKYLAGRNSMRCASLATTAFVLLGHLQAAKAADDAAPFQAAIEAATKSVGDDKAFQSAMDRLLTFLPQNDDGYHIVDGDIRYTDAEIRRMIRERAAALQGVDPWPESARNDETVLNTESGVPTCYKTLAERRLTYAIDEASFAGAPANAAAQIVDAMRQATEDWEMVCPKCGIDFVYANDPAPTVGKYNFIVAYVGPQRYIASAFFPNDTVSKRTLEIAASYYASDFDKVGVLRHELGHVLGYRHEHIRPEQAFQCYDPNDPTTVEPSNWTPLGDYDATSVMHYLCGGGGSPELKISSNDAMFHRQVYGRPDECAPGS